MLTVSLGMNGYYVTNSLDVCATDVRRIEIWVMLHRLYHVRFVMDVWGDAARITEYVNGGVEASTRAGWRSVLLNIPVSVFPNV